MTVVLGGEGRLGSALRGILPAATYLSRSDLDLADTNAIQPTLAAMAPTAVINCAAYTAVDDAEDDEDAATAVNCTAVGELASFAERHNITFVTFSTDYVFDGSATVPYVESDPPRPVNAYGRSKACGEALALARHPGVLVVRTSWLLSGTQGDFITKIVTGAKEGTMKVVHDQHGSPTIVDDLAVAVLEAVDLGLTGVVHLVNEGPATWFDVASAVVEVSGGPPGRIVACSTDEFPTRARRPAYSVLGSEVPSRPRLPHWRDSLAKAVGRSV